MKNFILYGVLLLVLTPMHSQIIITEVNYDSPFYEGSPNYHYHFDNNSTRRHLGEYIELYNFSNEDIPLKGWFITDYVGKYVFPENAVIPAEDFIIIAYNDPLWCSQSDDGLNTQNYFTTFFPNAIGKESQIYYQNKIILRNTQETLKLFIGELRGMQTNHNVVYGMSWENPPNFPFTNSEEATENPASYDFYTQGYSIHLNNSGNYFADSPTPFSSGYLPPTQNLEDIQSVIDALNEVYSTLTWKDYADAILYNTCSLALDVIEQIPLETYTNQSRCFTYDNSGNKIGFYDCSQENETSQNNGEEQQGYTNEQLDEINSKIILYPVPTNSILNIEWDDFVNGKISSIQFSNQNGVSIGTQTIQGTQSSTQFNFDGQPTGVFIVSFVLNSGQIISKNIMKM